MSEPHQTVHAYHERSGLDWCRVCGEPPGNPIHAVNGAVRVYRNGRWAWERVETVTPPWEEVALSLIESLAEKEISPELATDWLRMILNYAEAK